LAASKEVAAKLTASIDVQRPPLIRAALVDFGPSRPQHLVLTIHHFGFDPASMHTLVEELEIAYQQASKGALIRLPPRTTSFEDWARRLAEHAHSASMDKELAYWTAQRWDRIRPLPHDLLDSGAKAVPVAVTAKLDEPQVAALQVAQRRLGVTIEEVLAAALVETLAEHSGTRALWLSVLRHGRIDLFPDMDLSRTVGWFSTETPVMLDLNEARTFAAAAIAARAQLHGVPNEGIGYGILRYLRGAPFMTSLPKPEVRLNHWGHLVRQGLFEVLREGYSAPELSLDHLIEVRTSLAERCLWMTWIHDGSAFRAATLQRLADGLARRLNAWVKQEDL
jgi:non-ribosomal peptide synthase protein (TIGR01720 family)